jgi:DNA polymerase-3 subunit beta
VRGSFTVGAGALASAVKYTARWLVARPAIPEHGGLLFEVDGDRLNLFGFNENVTARATVAINATDEPKGAFVVAGRLMDALAATFPEKPIRFEQEGSVVTVTAGRFRATLPTMSEKDYPALPGAAALAGHVDGSLLADAVSRVAAAASRDLTVKIEQCGIYVSFDLADDAPVGSYTLTLMATDSYRAATQSIEWQPEHDEVDPPLGEAFLALGPALVDAAEAFAGGLHPVAIGWERGTVSLTTPERSLVSRTLDDSKFPKLGPLFNTPTSAEMVVRAKDLAMPLKRADLLKNRETDAVKLSLTANTATIIAQTEMSGGDEDVDVQYEGPDTTITVRSSVLHAALSSAPGDTVRIAFTPDTYRPLIFTSDADPTWRHLAVPLRPTS